MNLTIKTESVFNKEKTNQNIHEGFLIKIRKLHTEESEITFTLSGFTEVKFHLVPFSTLCQTPYIHTNLKNLGLVMEFNLVKFQA